ncbi:HAD-IC family P-type ATPase [Parasporobacterium paucivorans]|uniref:Cation-transporting ATPase E n=1 Tax=Parasporobacterium paucivorans DSM 15970 TaxID=1122934 RepID=A0A1M6G3K7_9FIRM|nr:HAD-IC family P-type ATPase [Parasporobacterium paucivorans]SHJ04546.1 cation-transporting ATPase E [Parasporobacterium paucivorans DSM 15970]
MDEGKRPVTGLSTEEVRDRQRRGLVNEESEIRTKSIKRIIADNLFTLFNLINAVLVVCIFWVHSYKNALFFGVVLWNAFIGIFQGVKAKRVIDKLSILSIPRVKVLRDGRDMDLEMHEIVMDDIMLLNAGNQIVADCIIVEGSCEVDESLLTGESIPVYKTEGEELLSGSFIISGNVKASVIHLGKDNYAIKITQAAKYIKKPNSEIMLSTRRMIKIITVILIPVALILAYKQLFMIGQETRTAVVSVVAAIASMIPSGFILLTTIVLEISAVRLAGHNTLAQDLYCTEILARVDMLCLDKTGTITEGTLELEDVVSLDGSSPEELAYFISAYINGLEDANPTFQAIKARYPGRSALELAEVIPFSSYNKWSLASYKELGSLILGAPEYVLPGEQIDGIGEFLDEGYRVLLFARSDNFPENRCLPIGIRPVAVLLLTDTLKKDVKETLDYFEHQGVTIKIISGDNPLTVSHVAKRAGVKGWEQYIDASTLQTTEETAAAALLYTVYGRVSPQQKFELVRALKDAGYTVAMTGDGVNDVLALKEADCSIAMQSGSDAARNTSQLVLLDSNFSSMPLIVEEGRRSINNLQRSASLYLIKTMYSAILAVFFVFASLKYPFEPIQMTLIGTLTIGVPSFFLALEKNTARVKKHFLRNVFKLAVPGGILVAANVLAALTVCHYAEATHAQTGTMCTISAAIASLIMLFYISSPLRPMRGVLLAVLAAGAIVALTALGFLFDIVSLTSYLYWKVLQFGIISFMLYGIYVFIIRRIKASAQTKR